MTRCAMGFVKLSVNVTMTPCRSTLGGWVGGCLLMIDLYICLSQNQKKRVLLDLAVCRLDLVLEVDLDLDF